MQAEIFIAAWFPAARMPSSAEMPVMQEKSIGHSRRKQGLHGT